MMKPEIVYNDYVWYILMLVYDIVVYLKSTVRCILMLVYDIVEHPNVHNDIFVVVAEIYLSRESVILMLRLLSIIYSIWYHP